MYGVMTDGYDDSQCVRCAVCVSVGGDVASGYRRLRWAYGVIGLFRRVSGGRAVVAHRQVALAQSPIPPIIITLGKRWPQSRRQSGNPGWRGKRNWRWRQAGGKRWRQSKAAKRLAAGGGVLARWRAAGGWLPAAGRPAAGLAPAAGRPGRWLAAARFPARRRWPAAGGRPAAAAGAGRAPARGWRRLAAAAGGRRRQGWRGGWPGGGGRRGAGSGLAAGGRAGRRAGAGRRPAALEARAGGARPASV